MEAKFIKPVPKYILKAIHRSDIKGYPEQNGMLRFYAYLTTIKKELFKITVAVKNYKKQWYCKQVAAHGVKSDKCWVRDMEYGYLGYGFRVGWHAEGLSKAPSWYEDGKWYTADCKYYNPCFGVINRDYISKFPEYRYSAYQQIHGCPIRYLKLYEQYPQVEYLIKLGLYGIHDSVTILKRIAKDKKFCKWLITNRDILTKGYYYIGTIMKAYKNGKPLKHIQVLEECKKKLSHDGDLLPVRELFKGKDLERFFSYLEIQKTEPRSYLDYLNACNYLGLDMSLPKNRFPHNFKQWHDIRIDEYHTAKALADEHERAELYAQFRAIAEKYISLQNCKKSGYAVFIARSPGELLREGEQLHHCVGRMNYDRKMIREESLIFFVRETESPDTPFVTVEYSPTRKKVLQCYGNESVKPDDMVLQFVNKVWLPHANRTIRKLAA